MDFMANMTTKCNSATMPYIQVTIETASQDDVPLIQLINKFVQLMNNWAKIMFRITRPVTMEILTTEL